MTISFVVQTKLGEDLRTMGRGTYCSVLGCRKNNWTRNDDGTWPDGFFRFPLDPKRCELWVKRVNRTLYGKEISFLRGRKVCRDHFTDDQFMNSLKNRLIHCAVPSLRLPYALECTDSQEEVPEESSNTLTTETEPNGASKENVRPVINEDTTVISSKTSSEVEKNTTSKNKIQPFILESYTTKPTCENFLPETEFNSNNSRENEQPNTFKACNNEHNIYQSLEDEDYGENEHNIYQSLEDEDYGENEQPNICEASNNTSNEDENEYEISNIEHTQSYISEFSDNEHTTVYSVHTTDNEADCESEIATVYATELSDNENDEENNTLPEDFSMEGNEWQFLPNELCRLCASSDDQPKQSIVYWLEMLKEIIPDIISLEDGLPQYICKACIQKLNLCCKIKQDFCTAYESLCQDTIKSEEIAPIEFPLVLKNEKSDKANRNNVSVKEADNSFRNEVTDNNLEIYETFYQENSDDLSGYKTAENGVGKSSSRKRTRYQYVCCECESLFNTISSFHKHLSSHKSLVCEFCNKVFTEEKFMKEHKLLHNNQALFVCKICQSVCRTEETLKNHYLIHKPPKYSCSVCDKKFRTKRSLKYHQGVHYSDLQTICEICGYRMQNKWSLRNHLLLHSGERYVQCHICGKHYSNTSLQGHMRSHEEPKYLCCKCGRKFHSLSKLKIHIISHSETKQFECPVCFYKFSTQKNKLRHLKVSCKSFFCVVCKQIFQTLNILTAHRASEHTEEELSIAVKIYKENNLRDCPICSKRLNGNRGLRLHMRRQHNIW